MTDPILYESQRDRYIRDKLMQHLGPKTKTEVLKAYYRKLSTNGYASANFVLEEIKANERVYDDWIKDSSENPETTPVLEPKIRLLQNETEEIPLTQEQEEHLRKLERMDELILIRLCDRTE